MFSAREYLGEQAVAKGFDDQLDLLVGGDAAIQLCAGVFNRFVPFFVSDLACASIATGYVDAGFGGKG